MTTIGAVTPTTTATRARWARGEGFGRDLHRRSRAPARATRVVSAVRARAETMTVTSSSKVASRGARARTRATARDDARDEDEDAATWWARAGHAAGTTALALAVAFATTVGTPDAALAAKSGGRMGGGSFRASSMSSFRAPRASSLGTSSYSAPSVGAPITRTSSFMVGPGFGYGFGMGPGLYFGGGGFFNFIFFVMMMLFVSNALQNLTSGGGFGDGLTAGGDSISVVKIQVGLLGTARSLQRDLERIADKADTSSPEGLHYVLEETALALLRNPEYCVYGYAASKVCRGPEQAEETFNDFSIDERGKFEQETLVNVNARKKSAAVGVDPDADTNDYILVTILAAADGGLKMPDITDATDLKTALKRLAAVRVEALQAVEVLWTPQEEGDVLTQTELLRDYPILVNL